MLSLIEFIYDFLMVIELRVADKIEEEDSSNKVEVVAINSSKVVAEAFSNSRAEDFRLRLLATNNRLVINQMIIGSNLAAMEVVVVAVDKAKAVEYKVDGHKEVNVCLYYQEDQVT